MESGAHSYSFYPPGIARPSRPPLRQHTPDEVSSGFPFLIGMAAIVLAASVGAVAKFCPQDLRLEHTRSHVAAPTMIAPPPASAAEPAPTQVITPMALTAVEAPPTAEPAPPIKKLATRGRRAAK